MKGASRQAGNEPTRTAMAIPLRFASVAPGLFHFRAERAVSDACCFTRVKGHGRRVD